MSILLFGSNLLRRTHRVSIDKAFLWDVRVVASGNRYPLPPPPFNDWFPCESVSEPLGHNIFSKDFPMYMVSAEVPETVGSQKLVISGIIDNIGKEMETWLYDWYESYHVSKNGIPFHHIGTLWEISRIFEVRRLNNQRETQVRTQYHVTLSNDFMVQLSNTSSAKKIDGMTFNIVGKDRKVMKQ